MDLERLREKVGPDHTALVIVDMQKDYCCEGGVLDKLCFDLTEARNLASRLDGYVRKVRGTVKLVIHLKMVMLPHLRSPAMVDHYRRVGLERQYDPSFAEFYGVVPEEGDVVIPKYRYSGFVSTYLDQCLRAGGITTLVIVGLATNVCVESTVRDGFMRDYHIVVPADMTEGTSVDAKAWSLKNIETFFGEVVDSRDLLACWGIHQHEPAGNNERS